MENDATLKIIKILVVVVGILYAGWSMLKKKTGTIGGARTLRERGENFPFPEPENSARERAEGQMIGEGAMEDRVWTADREGGGTMATTGTGSIVAEEAVGDDNDRGESGGEQEQVVTDLRTIIIANELLKPKYKEY